MKIEGGYYIKARQIQTGWVANAAPVVREVWDFLLMEANYKEKKYSGFIVKRGQLFRSYREIRDALKWFVGYRFERYSEAQTKSAMKLLRRESMIELTKLPRGNLITILNYNKYQEPKNYEATNEPTNEPTNDLPSTSDPCLSINKKVKKEKKEKKEYPPEIKNFTVAFQTMVLKEQPRKAPKVNENFLESCNNTINKLIKLDGFTLEYIINSLRWATKDDFWGNQVFSLAALRTKSSNGLKKFQNLSNAYDSLPEEKPKKIVYLGK